MLSFITRRRRAESARVDAFLHAITLSDRYTLDPGWELLTVADLPTVPLPLGAQRTDTVAFPRIVLAGTVL